jgi:hypothetical protein
VTGEDGYRECRSDGNLAIAVSWQSGPDIYGYTFLVFGVWLIGLR